MTVQIPMVYLKPFVLKRYDTLEALTCSQYEVESLDEVETIGGIIEGVGETIGFGDEQPISEYLDIRRAMGCDGYADTDTSVLHYWLDSSKISTPQAVQFFAHELAHLHRHPAGIVDAATTLECESDADQFATIACRAYELAVQHLEAKDERTNERYVGRD